MIPLFHIPNHIIDTSQFDHWLQGKIVRQFEERFAEYVGAKYAVSLHSASAGILLAFHEEGGTQVIVPSMLPAVVANQLRLNYCDVSFKDNVSWVGGSYLLHSWPDCRFIDSAQRLEKDQYKNECRGKDIMLFSFFPTKPLSSQDGGMIVSDDESAIEEIRTLANNGMQSLPPLEGAGREVVQASWQKTQTRLGYKMYMNSTAAYIAMKNMDNLEEKKEILADVREMYNRHFELANSSEHLYRVLVEKTDAETFIAYAAAAGIQCGIHYEALHHNPLFGYEGPALPLTDLLSKHMVSIPYHEKINYFHAMKIIEFVKRNR